MTNMQFPSNAQRSRAYRMQINVLLSKLAKLFCLPHCRNKAIVLKQTIQVIQYVCACGAASPSSLAASVPSEQPTDPGSAIGSFVKHHRMSLGSEECMNVLYANLCCTDQCSGFDFFLPGMALPSSGSSPSEVHFLNLDDDQLRCILAQNSSDFDDALSYSLNAVHVAATCKVCSGTHRRQAHENGKYQSTR